MIKAPQYPAYLGHSTTRKTRSVNAPPDMHDWDQIVAEVVKHQSFFKFAKTFILNSLETGDDVTNAIIIPMDCTLLKILIHAKTAPSGGDLVLDINPAKVPLTLEEDETDLTITAFDQSAFDEGDLITLDINTVSSADGITVEMIFQPR